MIAVDGDDIKIDRCIVFFPAKFRRVHEIFKIIRLSFEDSIHSGIIRFE